MNEENQILHYLRLHPLSSRREIMQGITLNLSPATGKRLLAEAVARGAIETVGKGPATRYRLAPRHQPERRPRPDYAQLPNLSVNRLLKGHRRLSQRRHHPD